MVIFIAMMIAEDFSQKPPFQFPAPYPNPSGFHYNFINTLNLYLKKYNVFFCHCFEGCFRVDAQIGKPFAMVYQYKSAFLLTLAFNIRRKP